MIKRNALDKVIAKRAGSGFFFGSSMNYKGIPLNTKAAPVSMKTAWTMVWKGAVE